MHEETERTDFDRLLAERVAKVTRATGESRRHIAKLALTMRAEASAAADALEALSGLGRQSAPEVETDVYIAALRRLSEVKIAAEALQKQVARHLVARGASTVEVGRAARVAQSTVSRWTASDRK